IVPGNPGGGVHRELIITLAARHRLPAIYNSRFWPAADGLMSYGPDFLDQCRRAAGYVDRILRGEKPSDLPVQAPTKFELVLNLKTAKALGLTVPDKLLATADEVIEQGMPFAALHESRVGPPLPPWSRDGAAAFGGITAARSARWRGSS